MGVRRPALLTAVLIVFAGCGGPSAIDTTTTTDLQSTERTTAVGTPTTTQGEFTVDGTTTQRPDDGERERVAVRNGTLPVNATRIFRRVEELLGTDATPPVVRVAPRSVATSYPDQRPFERLMGLRSPDGNSSRGTVIAGATAETVYLLFGGESPSNVSTSRIELVLVHEFVHVIQEQRGETDGVVPIAGDVPFRVRDALIEGGAVYVTDVYARRHDLTYPDGRTPIERRAHHYRTRPAWALDDTGRYYFGARYLDRRLSDPSDLWDVYADPPATMEQVIHGPGVEDAGSLSVAVAAGGWTVTARRTQGELSVRAMLRAELDRRRAARAATGWGNDTLIRMARGDRRGFVWAVRLDNRSAADTFGRALRDHVARRREATEKAFRVVRVAPETVVLIAGSPSFVGETTVTGTNESLTVAVNRTGSGIVGRRSSMTAARSGGPS